MGGQICCAKTDPEIIQQLTARHNSHSSNKDAKSPGPQVEMNWREIPLRKVVQIRIAHDHDIVQFKGKELTEE